MRWNKVVVMALGAMGAWGMISLIGSAPAHAQANPSSAIVTLLCGDAAATNGASQTACNNLTVNGSYLVGFVEWYSNGKLVFVENNPRVVESDEAGDSGLGLEMTGNGSIDFFQTYYVNPATSVFNLPNVTVKAWSTAGEVNLLILSQPYVPLGSALWALHCGDTSNLQAAIAAEAAARAAADSTINASLATEQTARIAGDSATLVAANAYTDTQIGMEATAREAADAALQADIAALAASTITINTGSGLSGGGTIPLGGMLTLKNTGVLSVIAGAGIAVSAATGNVTISATAPPAASCGNSNGGPTCAAAEHVPQLSWAGSTSRTGALPSGGSSEHWFVVSFANSGVAYHPHAYLSSGAAYYTLDTFLDCNGSELGCGAEVSNVSIGIHNWETTNGGDNPLWPTPSPGESVYIRVRPYTANQSCQSYTVIFQNG